MNRSTQRGRIFVMAIVAIVLLKALQNVITLGAVVWIALTDRRQLQDLGSTAALFSLQGVLLILAIVLCYFLYRGQRWAYRSLIVALLGLTVVAIAPSLMLLGGLSVTALGFGAFANGFFSGVGFIVMHWLEITRRGGLSALIFQLLGYFGGLALLLSPDVRAFLAY
ncbi:MAG: hypothetical protein F6K28_53370 [Microcoleus sp. SIO2G3]|nr:hypothetical protein [Microcoleus sp. SIO2G3]